MQRSDRLGVFGFILLLGGVWLFFTRSVVSVSWLRWIGGPFLWFAGFALVIGWAVSRWVQPSAKGPAPRSPER